MYLTPVRQRLGSPSSPYRFQDLQPRFGTTAALGLQLLLQPLVQNPVALSSKAFKGQLPPALFALKCAQGRKRHSSPEMQNRRAKIHGERGGEEGPGKAGMRAKVPCSLTAVLSLNSNDILCVALVTRWKRISQPSSWLGELMTCKWVWVRIVLAVVVVVNFSENSHEFFFFSILTCVH